MARFLQQADQLERLVCRNPAADDQEHLCHNRSICMRLAAESSKGRSGTERIRMRYHGMNKLFTNIASRISGYAGRAMTFVAAILIIVVWGASGPAFGFSDTWQLVVNTGTTII